MRVTIGFALGFRKLEVQIRECAVVTSIGEPNGGIASTTFLEYLFLPP